MPGSLLVGKEFEFGIDHQFAKNKSVSWVAFVAEANADSRQKYAGNLSVSCPSFPPWRWAMPDLPQPGSKKCSRFWREDSNLQWFTKDSAYTSLLDAEARFRDLEEDEWWDLMPSQRESLSSNTTIVLMNETTVGGSSRSSPNAEVVDFWGLPPEQPRFSTSPDIVISQLWMLDS